MNTTTLPVETQDKLLRLKIGITDIFLEEMGENQGKVTISNTYGQNYSHYWGAMGGTLKEFILSINSEYFADKLLGSQRTEVFDSKATMREVRKFIRTELNLPWYKHMEFQKSLRETLKDFENECESEDFFVSQFSYYLSSKPNFYLIEDRHERQSIENDFKNINEPWNFIHTKEGENYKWLKSIHKELKKMLSKSK